MFSAKNTESNPFRPALQYLLSAGKTRSSHRPSGSSSSIDSEGDIPNSRMSSYNPKSSTEFRDSPIPLINISRSPSPYLPRNVDYSDTDDDDWGDNYAVSSQQPFLRHGGQDQSFLTGWRWLLFGGGFGHWLFSTTYGWSLYILVLVVWLGGCEIGTMCINRIIFWTGVYKFPYPLTTTLLEMIIAHFWVCLSAYLTRWFSPLLLPLGVSGMIAPSRPLQSSNSSGFRGQQGKKSLVGTISELVGVGTGGIAGGGFFEFEWSVAKQCLPVAIIFVAKVVFSNLSFAYAEMPVYVLARIGIVPFSLILTSILTQHQHSVTIISATLTATLTLMVGAIRANVRVIWEPIVTGILSSFFVALYPIQVQRTYKSLLASLIPQGELLSNANPNPNPNNMPDVSGTREEARAYWRLIHYNSLLAIIIFLPIPFLTGEIANISRNCYFLDVAFHWLMVLCGGLGSWATYWCTIALTRATSPLTASFLFIPEAAFLLPIMAGFKLPSFAWIGIAMCWASCAWFLRGRMKEGRQFSGLR